MEAASKQDDLNKIEKAYLTAELNLILKANVGLTRSDPKYKSDWEFLKRLREAEVGTTYQAVYAEFNTTSAGVG